MIGCPICTEALTPFLSVEDAPVFCNVLYDSPGAAIAAARGRIELAVCGRCGLIRNTAFDPERVSYSPDYENSLHFSPTFRSFAEDLAQRLVERYELRGKDVVDIGCGKGDFLELLCRGNGNRGVGYDPSYEGELVRRNGSDLTFVRQYFSAEHAVEPADLIACRHVLEHLDSPGDLLGDLGASDAVLYLEMPDAGYMLREAAIWDVIYEHVSYFSGPALRRLLEEHGFGVLDVGSSFGGQYLYAEAARSAPATRADDDVPAQEALAGDFGATYRAKVAGWTERLARLHADRRRVALWGTGSKGVTFLNAVQGAEQIAQVIDVNARKHGRYVPGTGQRVESPASLRSQDPDVVLVMNPRYVQEIRRALADAGVRAEVLVV